MNNINLFKNIIKFSNSIKDGVIKQHAVIDRIMSLDNSQMVELFHYLLINIYLTDERNFYIALIRVLLEDKGIPQTRKEKISHEFTLQNLEIFGKMILKIDSNLKYNDFLQENYEFEEIPLGIRKAKARQHNRDVLLKILFDFDPEVIFILLDNSLIKEEDVVKIAAKRPQNPAIFSMVFFHKKWLLRQVVQRAIVKNPFTPPHFSVSIMPLLNKRDLIEIQNDETLHESVTETAMFVINLQLKT